MLLNEIQLTGFVLFPVALVGTVCNWTVVYILQKIPSFRHAFGYLSGSQAVADALHSTFFLIYFCPMVISGSEFLKAHSAHCGFILLLSYEFSVQIHLVISLNRFFAAWSPYRYKSMFSDKNTKIIIVVVWVLTFGASFTFYEVLCNLYYDEMTGFFTFTATPLCGAIGWYADFCKYLTIVCLIVLIDISTILRVRSVNRKVQTSMDLQTTSKISTREINFLKQTVFQGTVFALELITYFILPAHLSNKWAIFFCTSFAWVLVHAIDGVIMMTFNPEFKKFILTCGREYRFATSNDTYVHSHVNGMQERSSTVQPTIGTFTDHARQHF